MKEKDVISIVLHDRFINVFESGQYTEASDNTISIMAASIEMSGKVLDKKLNKIFDHILQTHTEDKIKETHRDNFKNNLWMIFIERGTIDKDKYYGVECINGQTKYLSGALRGFLYAMDKIMADKNFKITAEFISELHHKMLLGVNNETNNISLDNIAGRYHNMLNASNGTLSGCCYGYVSIRFLYKLLSRATPIICGLPKEQEHILFL